MKSKRNRLYIRYFYWIARFLFYLSIALIVAFILEIIGSGSVLVIIGVVLDVVSICWLCSLSDELVSKLGED